MSLSQKSRIALYEGLSGVIPDEDAVEELLAQFPSRDLDEPVTKDYHRAETALLRSEFHADMAELRTEMADLRSEVRTEMAGLGSELRIEMHRGAQRLTVTLAALMVSMTGVIVAALTVSN